MGSDSIPVNALLFLHSHYRQLLQRRLGDIPGIVRAKRKTRIPVVLTVEEVRRVLGELEGVRWLVACLRYRSGLRLLEAVRLRVKDLDFDHHALVVRDGKGRKDRVVTLPDELVTALRRHLEGRKTQHEHHGTKNVDVVYLPFALARKYPGAPRERGWQYVLAATRPSRDPRSGERRRCSRGRARRTRRSV